MFHWKVRKKNILNWAFTNTNEQKQKRRGKKKQEEIRKNRRRKKGKETRKNRRREKKELRRKIYMKNR